MSLFQLERQIELATVAMEKATLNGDKRMKSELKKELSSFQKVLERSKLRLKELTAMKKKCDEISEVRELEQSRRRQEEEKAANAERVREKI